MAATTLPRLRRLHRAVASRASRRNLPADSHSVGSDEPPLKNSKDAMKTSQHNAPQAQANPQNDIRGVLIAVARARLLLPNATIAEVLSFAPPTPVEGAPDWLLGRIRWRGWEVPLVAFSRMA